MDDNLYDLFTHFNNNNDCLRCSSAFVELRSDRKFKNYKGKDLEFDYNYYFCLNCRKSFRTALQILEEINSIKIIYNKII